MIIDVKWDQEATVWIAANNTIGLILEDSSYDHLMDRLKPAISEMCELNHVEQDACITINLQNVD